MHRGVSRAILRTHRSRVKRHQPLAARLVRHGGDDAACVAEELQHRSSIFMCGTISPAILLKRDSRSVMRMKPSSSIVAMSPVTYQPSRNTSARLLRLVRDSRASGSGP